MERPNFTHESGRSGYTGRNGFYIVQVPSTVTTVGKVAAPGGKSTEANFGESKSTNTPSSHRPGSTGRAASPTNASPHW